MPLSSSNLRFLKTRQRNSYEGRTTLRQLVARPVKCATRTEGGFFMPGERKPRERTVNEKVLQQMRRLLGKCPWISASESALWFPVTRFYGEGDRESIDPSTAHDALKLLCEQGEVSRRLAGRRYRAVYRHILNQAGIRVLYPDPLLPRHRRPEEPPPQHAVGI